MYLVKRKFHANGQRYAPGATIEDGEAEGLVGFGELVRTGALEKAEEPAAPKGKTK